MSLTHGSTGVEPAVVTLNEKFVVTVPYSENQYLTKDYYVCIDKETQEAVLLEGFTYFMKYER